MLFAIKKYRLWKCSELPTDFWNIFLLAIKNDELSKAILQTVRLLDKVQTIPDYLPVHDEKDFLAIEGFALQTSFRTWL